MKHLATLVISSLLGVTGCAVDPAPEGTADPASSSLATAHDPLTSVDLNRCQVDLLTTADSPGRNAWAGKCGYLIPAAVTFWNENFAYLVFTTGCGHAGCVPFVGVSTADPCVAGLVKLGLCLD
jgi:hypothetical protein